MTNQEILTKAIQRAIDGGWEPQSPLSFYNHDLYVDGYHESAMPLVAQIDMYPLIIFNHDFAKALWGEDFPMKDFAGRGSGWSYWQNGTLRPLGYWEKHLMDMVIAEDPIAYLGENI